MPTIPKSYILPRQRVTQTLAEATACYPITVLTAPMGYGKTTAAHELAAFLAEAPPPMDSLPLRVYFLSIPLGPHNALYLWDLIFGQLVVQGLEIAETLQRTGFPTDISQMHRVCTVCAEYAHPVLLIIDDYHYVTDPAMDAFLDTLIRMNMPDFHILLLSRTKPNLALEDLRVKQLTITFGQELLTFSQEEAIAFFDLHNGPDATQVKEVWSMSEGWPAALWLSLQSWHTHGVIMPLSDIEELLSQAVFATYPPQVQTFLLQLSILDSFSMRQAAFICDNIEAPRRIRELHEKNAFVSYSLVSDTYQLHSIFRSFLSKRLEETPSKKKESAADEYTSNTLSIDRPALYRQAGEWFIKTGDPVQAIRFLHQAGRDEDLLRILQIFDLPNDGLMVMFDAEGIPLIMQSIPWHLRCKYPLGWLSFVYNYMALVDHAKGVELMQEAALHFMAKDIISPDLQRLVAAELEMVQAIGKFNDMSAMRNHHIKAYALFQGKCSIVSQPHHIWTLGSPHVSHVYLRDPGAYEELVAIIEDHMPSYQAMTGGCSAGGVEVFRAEKFLETDTPRKVESLLMKGVYKAITREQITTLICATFTLARLRLSEGKAQDALQLLKDIRPQVEKTGNPLLESSLELAQGYIAACAKQKEIIPPWLQQEEIGNSPSFYQGLSFARIVHGKALLLAGDWARLEALAEELPAQLGPYRNLFGKIHARIMQAIAVNEMHGLPRAMPLFKQGIELARPDGIITSIAEYGSFILPLLKHLHKLHPEDTFIRSLIKATNRYKTKNSSHTSDASLAAQERIILEKAAQGLNNQEIAISLGLALSTIKNALNRIYGKLSVKNRSQAVQEWEKMKKKIITKNFY